MSKMKMAVIVVVVVVVGVPLMMMSKWYQITTKAEIPSERGVYGMRDMEIWIEINTRLPGPMRAWACETLRAREKVVMGGRNSYPPHGCLVGHGKQGAGLQGDRAVAMIEGFANNSALQAKARRATEAQQSQVYACVVEFLNKALTKEELAPFTDPAAAADRPKAQMTLGQKSREATQTCLKRAGL